MRNTLVATLLFLVPATALAAAAAPETPPREISVTGDAEVKVVPDQVILTLAVETSDHDLLVAKTQNDERVKKVLALTQQFKIEARHVQTDQITIEPRYKDNDRTAFLGYWVRKQIVICLKELPRFEELLTAVLKAGTNYVPGVEFQSTDLRKYRDQARGMAVKAAREKAIAMAGELGQKIGRPLSISENGGGYGYRGMGNAYAQNMSAAAGAESDPTEGGFAPGQISVRADVAIRFELE